MKLVNRVIKDSKQPPHSCSCITSPGAHATMQVACSVSTKPDMVPTDILVSFPFSPLLGALIHMFLYIYVSSYICCTPLSQTTSPCALKLHNLIRWAHLYCIAFPPACPPSPLYMPSSPATIAPPQCWADRNSGTTAPVVQGAFCHPLAYPSVKWSLSA